MPKYLVITMAAPIMKDDAKAADAKLNSGIAAISICLWKRTDSIVASVSFAAVTVQKIWIWPVSFAPSCGPEATSVSRIVPVPLEASMSILLAFSSAKPVTAV